MHLPAGNQHGVHSRPVARIYAAKLEPPVPLPALRDVLLRGQAPDHQGQRQDLGTVVGRADDVLAGHQPARPELAHRTDAARRERTWEVLCSVEESSS